MAMVALVAYNTRPARALHRGAVSTSDNALARAVLALLTEIDLMGGPCLSPFSGAVNDGVCCPDVYVAMSVEDQPTTMIDGCRALIEGDLVCMMCLR